MCECMPYSPQLAICPRAICITLGGFMEVTRSGLFSPLWGVKVPIYLSLEQQLCPVLYFAWSNTRCLLNGSAGEHARGHVASSVIF